MSVLLLLTLCLQDSLVNTAKQRALPSWGMSQLTLLFHCGGTARTLFGTWSGVDGPALNPPEKPQRVFQLVSEAIRAVPNSTIMVYLQTERVVVLGIIRRSNFARSSFISAYQSI